MEDRGIAEIERAAHAYVDARDARMSMSTEEQNRHTKMVATMRKHGKMKYLHRNGDEMIEVELKPKDATTKAKVRIVPFDEYGKKSKETGEPVIGGDAEPELDIDDPADDDPDDGDSDDPDDELDGDGDDDEGEGEEAER